jgi:hypothetical protein
MNTIEKHVPIPKELLKDEENIHTNPKYKYKYPIHLMEIGDSILINDTYNFVTSYCNSVNNRRTVQNLVRFKFVFQTQLSRGCHDCPLHKAEGWVQTRVWRIK